MSKSCYCVKCNIEENRKITLQSMALWACHLLEKQVEKRGLELAIAKVGLESQRELFVDMQRTYVKEVRSG